MDNKEFNKLFELWKKEKTEWTKDAAPAKGKDCLFFTELEEYVKEGREALTGTQKQHIQSCSYCQKMITALEKALQEEKQSIPIYERFTQALENLANTLTFPLKALPRLAPALVPVLVVIIIFTVFSNRPLELKNYSFEFAQPTIKTRGFRSVPEMTIEGKKFKISKIVTTADCYTYLFAIKEDKINLLIQEKIKGRVENTLPKEGWLEGEGNLILLLTKDPLKDTSSAEEIIIKNYSKGKAEILGVLRKWLKIKGINFYDIEYP